MKLAICTAIAALVLGATVHAAPSTRVEVQPSAIFIYATNTEDRSYNCSISFVWSHDDFGTRRSQPVNTVSGVNAKATDANIFRLSGSYVRVQIESGPNISCT